MPFLPLQFHPRQNRNPRRRLQKEPERLLLHYLGYPLDLGALIKHHGVELCTKIISGHDMRTIEELLLPVNGIGPKVIANFRLLLPKREIYPGLDTIVPAPLGEQYCTDREIDQQVAWWASVKLPRRDYP